MLNLSVIGTSGITEKFLSAARKTGRFKFHTVYSRTAEKGRAFAEKQGFDLSTYAGETCTAYTYRVTNYEGSTDTVLAQLFVYRNRVIGGDIHATAMDGFMHGLR